MSKIKKCIAILNIIMVAIIPSVVIAEPGHEIASISGTTLVANPEIPRERKTNHVTLASALRPICACESAGNKYAEPRQFEADGVTVRWGRVHPPDKGMCQINTVAHADLIKKLGVDVGTVEGNATVANKLYELYGLQPWKASEACWK